MRIGGVLNLLGRLLIILSLMLLTPLPFSFYYGDSMMGTFLACSLIGLLCGGSLILFFLPEQEAGHILEGATSYCLLLPVPGT